VLVVLVLVDFCGPLSLVRFPGLDLRASLGWCGVVVAGTMCGQIPGMLAARRAAATVAGQVEGRERASAAPGD
jgi:hypothetical protein